MRITLLFAAIAVSARTLLFYGGYSLEGANIVWILLAMMVGLTFLSGHLLLRKEPNAPVLHIFREAMRDASLFSLLYAVFLWAFFTWLNVHEFPDRIAAFVADAMRNGHPEAEARTRFEAFFTPGRYAMITFFGLLVFGAFNALFFAVLQYKVLRRFRR